MWGLGPRCRYGGLPPPTRGSRLQLPAPAQKIGFGGSGRGVVTGLVVPSRARNIGFPLIDANCWGSGRGVVTGLIVPSPLSNIVKPYQQHATCTFFAASRKGSAKRHLPLRLHSSHSSGPTPRLLCFLSAALSNCRAPHKRPHAAPVQRYSSASCAVQPFRPHSEKRANHYLCTSHLSALNGLSGIREAVTISTHGQFV